MCSRYSRQTYRRRWSSQRINDCLRRFVDVFDSMPAVSKEYPTNIFEDTRFKFPNKNPHTVFTPSTFHFNQTLKGVNYDVRVL